MRDVVVVGGGLTGLAAAYELEQAGVAYTLIEVKPRLGGSIQTVTVNDFRFDSGPMGYPLADPTSFEAYLKSLDLVDQVLMTTQGKLAFQAGAGGLIDALAARLTAPVMTRMAVSTLGMMDATRYSICLENGILLDARGLIVTAPARYAERLFHTLTPEISYQLLDYRYDTITRVSVGYAGQTDLNIMYPQDSPVMEITQVEHAARLPGEQGSVLQAGLRFEPDDLPDDPVGELAALLRWPLNPDADHIATWPESDPAMWRQSDHPRTMATIQALLPPGVALAGSDYVPTTAPPTLDERIQQGQAAARRVLAYLES
jgi:predicted NAD/FAD-dependent oxidoreductase